MFRILTTFSLALEIEDFRFLPNESVKCFAFLHSRLENRLVDLVRNWRSSTRVT